MLSKQQEGRQEWPGKLIFGAKLSSKRKISEVLLLPVATHVVSRQLLQIKDVPNGIATHTCLYRQATKAAPSGPVFLQK